MNAKHMIENNMAVELVREMCEFTAQQAPESASRAMALADAFAAWATPAWVAKAGNGTMTGKEWVRAAMAAGFKA